ncbi:MAG: SURF1 family protein [Alphaproteobacteria bacterium]
MPSKARFRPRLWPTLIALPMVLTMLGLSLWQLDRRSWKHEMIALRTARIAAPAIDLPKSPDLGRLQFRKMRVRGRYLHGKELFVGARSRRGNLGYHIYTPFVAVDGSTILVNRGWVPLARKQTNLRRRGQIVGEIELIGHLRGGGRKGFFTPDNVPGENFWFYIDIPAMAAHVGISRPRAFYLQVSGQAPPGGWPRPVAIWVTQPDNHLQYAFTWAALAVALLVIYLLYHRRRPD